MSEETKVKESAPEEKKVVEKKAKSETKVAIVVVRGVTIGLRKEVKETLKMLNLESKYSCTIVPKNPSYVGMIKKIKDYITWGEIDAETEKALFEKRGSEYKGRTEDSKGIIKYGSKYVEFDGKKYKKYFRLSPPKGGWERKGTKKPLTKGGALGNRGTKISELIKKML